MIPSTWARHSDSAALDDVVAAPRATTSMYAACVTWRMLAVAHARVVATQVELGLDFMEAVHGCDKEISFNANHKCTTCNGSGALADSKPVTCKKCNGKGVQVMSAGFMMMTSPCSACEGAGRIPSKPCGDCKSTGVVRKMKKLKVTIPAGTSECLTELQHSSTHSPTHPPTHPLTHSSCVYDAGVENGANIRLPHQGNAGMRGGATGHVFLRMRIGTHPVFRRMGSDIHIDTPIPMTVAALGGQIEVPTVDGTMPVQVPQGTQPEERAVLRGKGVPISPDSRQRGNQYVHFKVSIPKYVITTPQPILRFIMLIACSSPGVDGLPIARSNYLKSLTSHRHRHRRRRRRRRHRHLRLSQYSSTLSTEFYHYRHDDAMLWLVATRGRSFCVRSTQLITQDAHR